MLATYVNVESLTAALGARDNGIVSGRRGTGKTHALKYVAQTERGKGNRVVYIDMEQDVGSTEGRYADPNLSLSLDPPMGLVLWAWRRTRMPF